MVVPVGGIQFASHLKHLIPAFTHASFIGLQERFLDFARNDDTGSLMSPSHQSLVPSHYFPTQNLSKMELMSS